MLHIPANVESGSHADEVAVYRLVSGSCLFQSTVDEATGTVEIVTPPPSASAEPGTRWRDPETGAQYVRSTSNSGGPVFIRYDEGDQERPEPPGPFVFPTIFPSITDRLEPIR